MRWISYETTSLHTQRMWGVFAASGDKRTLGLHTTSNERLLSIHLLRIELIPFYHYLIKVVFKTPVGCPDL